MNRNDYWPASSFDGELRSEQAGALVYDRYYCSRPHTAGLVAKRILLAVIFCVGSIMYILSQYDFPVSSAAAAVICGICCAAVSVLSVFVKKRWIIAGAAAVSGLLVWVNFGLLRDKLSYFCDAFALLPDGRILSTSGKLFHEYELLTSENADYVGGVWLGTVILSLLYGFVTALCFSGKLRPIIPATLFAALCVPVMFSEDIEFGLWLIPTLAALAGAFAIRGSACGIAERGGGYESSRAEMRAEERSFLKHTSSAPYLKRTEMRCNYYSKYFGTGVLCAVLTAVCLFIGAVIVPAGGSIDYSAAYTFVTGLFEGSAAESPFESGSASEYFSQSSGERESLLNVVSPGRGEREIISVTFDGDTPFYLRGDIGVDFNGSSWTTVVGSEPDEWSASGLKESYRPCENRVIAALLKAFGADGGGYIKDVQVSIEYLCSTDVVFLPPYTVDYSFYGNDSFEIYGDYAVRVSESAGGVINSVDCAALVPSYTSNENSGNAESLAGLEQLLSGNACVLNELYSTVVPEMQQEDILADYGVYVENTYLSVPDSYVSEIESYIKRCLYDEYQSLLERRDSGEISETMYRYLAASAVAEYLRSSYTYSLDGSNGGSNPVLKFLNETKRGHCSLYASAMTLILREMGIPARYCTGFYVESADGSNTVLLREKNLHAWTEVYIGEYGWVTFDPTSSSAYPDSDGTTVGTADETEPSTEQATQQPTAGQSTEETAQQTQQATLDEKSAEETVEKDTAEAEAPAEKSGSAPPILPFAAGGLVLIGAAAAVILRYRYLKKDTAARLERLKAEDNSTGRIFPLLLDLLRQNGLTPMGGELPGAFWKRVDGKFGTDFEEQSPLLEAMEFGLHDISDEGKERLFGGMLAVIDKTKSLSFTKIRRTRKLIAEHCNKL